MEAMGGAFAVETYEAEVEKPTKKSGGGQVDGIVVSVVGKRQGWGRFFGICWIFES